MTWSPQQIAGAVLAGGAVVLLLKDGGLSWLSKLFVRTPAPAPEPPQPADEDVADLLALKRLDARATRQKSKALAAGVATCMAAFFSSDASEK